MYNNTTGRVSLTFVVLEGHVAIRHGLIAFLGLGKFLERTHDGGGVRSRLGIKCAALLDKVAETGIGVALLQENKILRQLIRHYAGMVLTSSNVSGA